MLLAGAPCAERACFVTAAEKCSAATGSLPIVDWTGMFGVDAKGRTEISAKPGEAGACVVTLDLVVTDFKPKTDIPRQKAIDRLNSSPRYHLKCVGTTEAASRLLRRARHRQGELLGARLVQPDPLLAAAARSKRAARPALP